jgi:DNA repair protein RecO (recombination protein O)
LNFKGIIIRTVDYKEKDKLLSIATFEKGLICVNAKGVRAPNAKLKSYANVLTFGEFTLTEGKAGYLLSGVDCQENFFNCWTDTIKYSASMLCVELLEKISKQQEEIVYELVTLLKVLNNINYSDTYPLVYSLEYMAKMSDSLGLDYDVINDHNPKVYELIKRLSSEESDICKDDIKENDIINGIKFLNMIFKSSLNINLKIITEILKTL